MSGCHCVTGCTHWRGEMTIHHCHGLPLLRYWQYDTMATTHQLAMGLLGVNGELSVSYISPASRLSVLLHHWTKPQVWRFSRLFIWRQGACRCNRTRTRSPVITALKASSLGTLQPPIETVFTCCQWFYNNLYSWPNHSSQAWQKNVKHFLGFFILSPHQLQLKSSHLLYLSGELL